MMLKNIWGTNKNENFFRKRFMLAEKTTAAYLRIFADTGYRLFINGRFVAALDEWHNNRDYNVGIFLKKGENLIAIHGINHSGHRGVAAELAADGSSVCATDETWLMSPCEKWGWTEADFDDSAWQSALPLDLSAAGAPQWQTLPGSDPDMIIPTLKTCLFTLGSIPKACDSPYWSSKEKEYVVEKRVAELLGEEYVKYAAAPDLPPIAGYADIIENAAKTEGGTVRIETTERYTGPSFIVDFGQEVMGFFRMRIRSDKPVSFRLRYAEILKNAVNEMPRDMCAHEMVNEEFRVFGGEHEFEAVSRVAFRYVRVEFFDSGAEVYASDFSVKTALYPVKKQGYFSCGDKTLDKLWKMSEKTLHLCMQEYYLDAPWRDRFLWTGDARLEALFNYWLFGDTELFEYCWEELARLRYPNGAIPSSGGPACSELWDYVAWYVIAFHDYYMFTGNSGFILKNKATAFGAADYLMSLADESGLINVPENPLGELWMVELNAFVGYDPYLNSLYLRSLDAAAEIAELDGDESRKMKYKDAADKIRGIVKETASAKKLTEQFGNTQHIQLQYEMAEKILEECGTEKMLERLRQQWGGMTMMNADCLRECAFGDGVPEKIDEIQGKSYTVLSHCHAWSGAAASLLPMGIAGIRALKPGFELVRIAPCIGAIKEFRCAVPTPHGCIAVKLEDGVFSYSLPRGVRAELVMPHGSSTIEGSGQVAAVG